MPAQLRPHPPELKTGISIAHVHFRSAEGLRSIMLNRQPFDTLLSTGAIKNVESFAMHKMYFTPLACGGDMFGSQDE